MRPWRAILLRIMLTALAVAAGGGALAFLFANGDWAGRIMAMAIATAIASAVLIGAMTMMDRPKLLWAGAVLAGATLIEYLGALYLIGPARFLRQTYGLEQGGVEGTLIAVAFAVWPAMIGAMMIRSPRFRLAGVSVLTVSGISLLIWVFGSWDWFFYSSGYWWWNERVWSTGGVIMGMGLIGSLALLDFAPGTRRHWRWLGVLGSIITSAGWIWDIWMKTGGDPWPLILSTSVAIVVAFVMVTLAAQMPPAHRWLALATIAAGVASGVLLDIAVLMDEFGPQNLLETWEFLGRSSGAAGILAGCGLLATWIVARIFKPPRFEALPVSIKAITLYCPRCQKKQTLALGESQCSQCLLHLAVKVAEPQCDKCGYLLYGASGGRCPECGHAVAEPGEAVGSAVLSGA